MPLLVAWRVWALAWFWPAYRVSLSPASRLRVSPALKVTARPVRLPPASRLTLPAPLTLLPVSWLCRPSCAPLPPGFVGLTSEEIVALVKANEAKLNALARLRGFSIATEGIYRGKGSGTYHLVELNTVERRVSITPYATARLADAEAAYADAEKRAQEGEPIDVVLIAAGSVEAMRRAYPNYFLDAQGFVSNIGKLIDWVPRSESWTEWGPLAGPMINSA